ncbi:bifunctional DNA primase/polymerase [Actinomadura oligospora]|uniref:bifunctional DNA primase/polymerase n=1 Tax=Actinomadura oligospora TaxID=111804 RepID=UPI0004B6C3A7|nr:bifunctional DNA primase/polymerase [Actinomadura oligospora]
MTDDLPRRPMSMHALAHASRGWRIFPLRPGDKRPVRGFTDWEQHATDHPARIRAFWGRGPFNIAIACGPSNLVVIDLDRPKPGQSPPPNLADEPGICEGADAFAALCERHGQPFPFDTLQVSTGRGGLHLYFTAPDGVRLGNTTERLGWLIDTRAAGGYVVAPGSTVNLPDGTTGTYEVIHDAPPARLPGWLTELLTPAQPRHHSAAPDDVLRSRLATLGADRITRYADRALRGEVQNVLDSPAHQHNTTLFQASIRLGQLIAAGVLPRDLAQDALQKAGEAVGQPSAEAAATIRSGMDRGAREPRRVA